MIIFDIFFQNINYDFICMTLIIYSFLLNRCERWQELGWHTSVQTDFAETGSFDHRSDYYRGYQVHDHDHLYYTCDPHEIHYQ